MRFNGIVVRALVLLLALVVAYPAFAADTGIKVAVVDLERVRRNAAAVQGVRTQLNGYLDQYRSDTLKEEQEIRTAQEELANKRNAADPEGYAEERRKLETRIADAQGRVQRRRQALERVNSEALQKVQEALELVVADIARERGLTLILRKDQTIFAQPSVEITDEVLQRLDQKLPNVTISDPGG